MNIGIDIRALDTSDITGIDTYLRHLLEQWIDDSKDHKFYFLGNKNLRRSKIVKTMTSRGHKFTAHPWSSKVFNASMRFLGRPYLDKVAGNVDVFFSPNPMFHSFSRDTKTVVAFHDLSFERLKRVYSFKRNLWHKFVNPKKEALETDTVIAVSKSTASDLSTIYGVDRSKIEVVPLGVDFEKFSRKSSCSFSLPKDYILFLGSLEPRKNTASLIESFKILKKEFPNLNLILAGSFFPQKDKKALKAISGLQDVLTVGPVSEDDKVALYQNAKLTVLPSLYEGFGFPIIESMASGTPVITSSNSSMPEVSRGASILINPLNITELTQAIELVLTNEKLRNKLISQGKEVAGQYSWKQTADKTLEILEKTA